MDLLLAARADPDLCAVTHYGGMASPLWFAADAKYLRPTPWDELLSVANRVTRYKQSLMSFAVLTF